MTDERRPVRMSRELAEHLGWLEDAQFIDAQSVCVLVTEAELSAFDNVSRIDWGEPDAQGYYAPTIYSDIKLAAY